MVYGALQYSGARVNWVKKEVLIPSAYERGRPFITFSISLCSHTKETSLGFSCVLWWISNFFPVSLVFLISWLKPHF